MPVYILNSLRYSYPRYRVVIRKQAVLRRAKQRRKSKNLYVHSSNNKEINRVGITKEVKIFLVASMNIIFVQNSIMLTGCPSVKMLSSLFEELSDVGVSF